MPEEWQPPKLLPGAEEWLDGFYVLLSEVSGSSHAIPWSSIVKYARYMGYDDAETHRFVVCIRQLNFVYHKCRTTKTLASFFGTVS